MPLRSLKETGFDIIAAGPMVSSTSSQDRLTFQLEMMMTAEKKNSSSPYSSMSQQRRRTHKAGYVADDKKGLTLHLSHGLTD